MKKNSADMPGDTEMPHREKEYMATCEDEVTDDTETARRKDSPLATCKEQDTHSLRQPLYIAVMGVTGAGKSYFIQQMTKNDDVVISDSQLSCTQQIGAWQFDLDGTLVTLLDTPGFDDSLRHDTDTLQEIADWFKLSLDKGHKLAGIIYIHPIIHNRMTGSSRRNLRLFRNLCGDTNMSNVVLATSQWANLSGDGRLNLTPQEVGAKREEELRSLDSFYKPMLDNGARYERYQDYETGIAILRSLMHKQPFLTDLAQELGANTQLIDTAAGKVVNDDLVAAEKKHRQEIEQLRQDMKAASEKDRIEILADIQEATEKCNALEADRDRLASAHENHTRDMENRLNEMLRRQDAKEQALQAQLSAVQADHQQGQQKFNSYKAEVDADRQRQEKRERERQSQQQNYNWAQIAKDVVVPLATELIKKNDDRASSSVTPMSNGFPSTLKISWDDGMRLGMGYNGVTKQLAACALEDMQLSSRHNDPTVEVVLSTLRTEEDKQRYIGSKLKASAAIFGVGAKASFDQSHSYKHSETTMTAILECHVQQTPVSYNKTPVLTQAARDLLQAHPENFARSFGQYFVAGQICKSSLSAILTFSAQSKEQLDEIAASIGVEKGPAAIDVAGSYMEKASQSRVAVECKWHSTGISTNNLSTLPSTSDIKNIFKNYKSMVPEPQLAILQLYSTIDSTVALSEAGSKDMGVCSDALRRVANIQREYGDCRSLEAKRVLRAVTSTAEDISSIRAASSGWQTVLEQNLATLDDYKQQLEVCRVREDLISRTQRFASQLTKPQEYDPKFTRWFEYGVIDATSTIPSLKNEIKSKEEEIRVHGNGTVQYIHREWLSGGTIIGFRVQSNWHDDTNGAFTIEEGGVGHAKLRMTFKTRNCRGGHWTVYLDYVEGNGYILE